MSGLKKNENARICFDKMFVNSFKFKLTNPQFIYVLFLLSLLIHFVPENNQPGKSLLEITIVTLICSGYCI